MKYKTNVRRQIKKNRQLYLFLLLPVIYIIVFKYIPMGGVVIAFKDFKITRNQWATLFFRKYAVLSIYSYLHRLMLSVICCLVGFQHGVHTDPVELSQILIPVCINIIFSGNKSAVHFPDIALQSGGNICSLFCFRNCQRAVIINLSRSISKTSLYGLWTYLGNLQLQFCLGCTVGTIVNCLGCSDPAACLSVVVMLRLLGIPLVFRFRIQDRIQVVNQVRILSSMSFS